MRALEGPAGTFNVHDVTNTLWTCATMGRDPGAEGVRVLEARAETLADARKCTPTARQRPRKEEDQRSRTAEANSTHANDAWLMRTLLLPSSAATSLHQQRDGRIDIGEDTETLATTSTRCKAGE